MPDIPTDAGAPETGAPGHPPRLPVCAFLRPAADGRPLASAEDQRAAIAAFAEAWDMEVVRTFEAGPAAPDGAALDAGAAAGAGPALDLMLAAAEGGGRDFIAVLAAATFVFDDPAAGGWRAVDARLKAAGVLPVYAAEPQHTDGRRLRRGVEAFQAAGRRADHGRRVAAGKRRLELDGFTTGGQPPYGYRRLEVGRRHAPRVLDHATHKAKYTRIRLVPGPAEEVETVRRIFALYARQGWTAQQIAERLNAEGVPAGPRGPWRKERILRLIRNPTYAGRRPYWRGSDGRNRGEAPIMTVPGFCDPIVDEALFALAQARQAERHKVWTEAEIRDGLERLRRRHGKVTWAMVDEDPELPCRGVVFERVGGLGGW